MSHFFNRAICTKLVLLLSTLSNYYFTNIVNLPKFEAEFSENQLNRRIIAIDIDDLL